MQEAITHTEFSFRNCFWNGQHQGMFIESIFYLIQGFGGGENASFKMPSYYLQNRLFKTNPSFKSLSS